MAGVITNPDLISILVDHPNSIFVIEDAENIVWHRERNGDSPLFVLEESLHDYPGDHSWDFVKAWIRNRRTG